MFCFALSGRAVWAGSTMGSTPEAPASKGYAGAESDGLLVAAAGAKTEALPNLTPYKPSGWSGKIVVSNRTETTVDSAVLHPTDTLYVDWAVLNSGGDTAVRFHSALYVDGALKMTWYTDPVLETNYYAYVKDYSIGSLPVGEHTLKIVADYKKEIAESNESDNSFSRTIEVVDVEAKLTPAHDQDGDGVPDVVDPLPLNKAVSSLTPFDETEFNNNLGQANDVSGNLPLLIRGTIAQGTDYYLDIDYFRIQAKAGDRISVLAYSGTVNDKGTAITFKKSPFIPRLSFLDGNGGTMTGVNIEGVALPAGLSVKIPADGEYFVQVSDTTITAGDYSYPYVLQVFKDTDGDGVSNHLEKALNMSSQGADTDQDGLGDYSEVFSFSLKANGIKKPVNPSSADWWDTDKDGKPNWLDKDSDGDGIQDGVEGVADYEADNLPSFLDIDANGNAVPDKKEVGKTLRHPDDADADGIPDFQDLDLDGDGIPNASDAFPYDSSRPKASTGLVIHNVVSQVSASVKLWGVVVPGKPLIVYGKGITQDSRVVMPVSGGSVALKPASVGNGFLKIAVPKRVVEGLLFIMLNSQRSDGFPILVRNLDADPILTSLSSRSVKPNGTLTLYGKNLSNDQVAVVFENAKGSVSVSQKAAMDSVQVTVPQDAAGGKVWVEVGARKSNALDLRVSRNIAVSVALPSSLKVSAGRISVIANGKRYTLNNDYKVQIPSLNQDIVFLSCMVDMGSDDDYALLFEGVALPGKKSVTLSPLSTATKMVFFGLGYSVSLPRDKWEKVVTTLKTVPAVTALSNHITKLLASNLRALSRFENATLITKLQEAIIAGSKVVTPQLKASMAAGQLPQADLLGLEPVITPKDEQEGVALSVKDPADITVKNGTKLFASIEVTAKDKKKTLIQGHARHMYDPLILGPSGWIGYYTSYFKTSKDYKVAGRDSHFEVITAGVKDPNPDASKASAHQMLIMKLVLEGMVCPTVDKFVIGPLFNQSYDSETIVALLKHFIGMKSLNRMAAEIINSPSDTASIVYNIVVMQFVTALKSCGFPPNPGSPCYLLCEAIAQTLFKGAMSFESVAKIVGSSIGKQIGASLIPVYGQIRAALATADKVSVGFNVAVSIYDMANTPGLLSFNVDFPLEISQVKPLCLSKSDTVNQFITIVGKGIHPAKDEEGNDVLPKVYLGSADGTVWNWGDGDGDLQELYVSFGKVSLADGEYPIRVVHQGQEAVSEEKVRVFQEGAVLDLIDPSKGAEGDTVVFYGCGIGPSWAGPGSPVYDPEVFFTAEGGKTVQSAGVQCVAETILNVVVPEKAVTGPAYVKIGNVKSNSLPFTVEQSQVVITYGDCGAATDDTFDLFVDGEPKWSMAAPATPFPVTMNLAPGKHEVRLVGVTAPDAIGTYCISFSSNVQVVSGPPLSGDDLTAGVVKTWVIEVIGSGDSQRPESEDIRGLILQDLPG